MSAVLRVVRAQFRHDPLAFSAGLLVALVPAAAGVLLLGISGWFITAAAVAGLSGVFLNIFAPSAIIRALAILRTGGRYGERLLTHEATFRFLAHLRNRLFSGFTAQRHRGARSAALLNRLTLDIAALDTVYLRLVVPGALLGATALALLLWWASVSLAVLTSGLVFLLAFAALAAWAVLRGDRRNARRADAALEAMRMRAADLAAGRRDLAVYGGLDEAARAVLAADERLQAAGEIEDRRAALLTALAGLAGQIFLVLMLGVAVAGALAGTFSAAFAVALVLVAMAVPEITAPLFPGLARLPRIALAARRTGLLAEEKDSGADPLPDKAQEGLVPSGPGNVLAFRNVGFRYPGAARSVLGGFDLEIASSEVVALAGRSGCGKSTVAALAARLLSPGSGTIAFLGADLAGLGEDALRARLTVLGQRAWLFNDTVAANLRVARADASDADLWAVLDQAALAESIADSPDGLDTVLGEGGLGLSGGEQRRLALARALLTRPALFILDEMTEGLDEATAAEVLDRFFAVRGDAAVLMIAHKIRELDRADRIVRLD